MGDNIADTGTVDVKHRNRTLYADLMYPPYENKPNQEAFKDNTRYIEVGLSHVRAADNIRISYHFERDGWLIEQAQIFSWDCNDRVCDPKWKEVAFVQAWGSQIETGHDQG